jgi:hypothetical protein
MKYNKILLFITFLGGILLCYKFYKVINKCNNYYYLYTQFRHEKMKTLYNTGGGPYFFDPRWKKGVEAHFLGDRFLRDVVHDPRFPPSGADRTQLRAAWLRRHLALRIDPGTGRMFLVYRAERAEVAEARKILLFIGDKITNDTCQPHSSHAYDFEWYPRVISVMGEEELGP